MEKPTSKFYGLFQYLFDSYNEFLFNNELKDCLIVITRKKNVMGHYAYKRWFHIDDNDTDELALNPNMFLKFPLMEICQTLVHEMCHGWQYHYGKPSRAGYHNKEWAEKMISVGLMPSANGQVGGKTTGQQMSDYPIIESDFITFSEELINNEVFAQLYYEVNPNFMKDLDQSKPLFDQIRDLTLDQDSQPKGNKTKIKYSCSCSNVWGKPDLELYCKICEEDLFPAD
jgi:predicted SprT family Zn-dependent metalloprotease